MRGLMVSTCEPSALLPRFTCRSSDMSDAPAAMVAERGTYTTPAIPVSMGLVTNSRGSVTCPVRAEAAAVSGEAR